MKIGNDNIPFFSREFIFKCVKNISPPFLLLKLDFFQAWQCNVRLLTNIVPLSLRKTNDKQILNILFPWCFHLNEKERINDILNILTVFHLESKKKESIGIVIILVNFIQIHKEEIITRKPRLSWCLKSKTMLFYEFLP